VSLPASGCTCVRCNQGRQVLQVIALSCVVHECNRHDWRPSNCNTWRRCGPVVAAVAVSTAFSRHGWHCKQQFWLWLSLYVFVQLVLSLAAGGCVTPQAGTYVAGGLVSWLAGC
jgi:hypothetical protein